MLQSVALVGATHGNETSGIQLIKNWLKSGIPAQYDNALSMSLHLANQEALKANVRFVEQDLNRQFSESALKAEGDSKEARLAQKINAQFGPKGNANTDLVIDIHNTTSAMGATLIILEASEFYIQMARFVKQKMPEANILLENEKPVSEHGYLCTTGKYGVMLEIGGQPQGVLKQEVFQLTEALTLAVLDFCLAYQQGQTDDLPACEVYQLGHEVYFPLSESGEREAMVHYQLQDADFAPLLAGQPIFKCFDGSEIVWEGESPTYPHFINEAAYATQHVAFATASVTTL